MQSRMKHPAFVLPDARKALYALDKATENLPYTTRKLVHLRASQINGCSVCTHMHSQELKKAGESDDRIYSVVAWRDTTYFSDAERAALALTEALTRVADHPEPVPDDIWNEAARYFNESELAALTLQIGLINVWNRLNTAVKQPAGVAWS